MSKTIELARHLETLHINDMYKTDFYWTWDKTDDEIDAVFTVADALRDLRERNKSTRIFDSGLGISIFRDNSTRTRFSFASACNLLGLEVQDLDEKKSQIAHGETVRETANMVSFMADVIGIRDDMFIGEGHKYQTTFMDAVKEGYRDGILEQQPIGGDGTFQYRTVFDFIAVSVAVIVVVVVAAASGEDRHSGYKGQRVEFPFHCFHNSIVLVVISNLSVCPSPRPPSPTAWLLSRRRKSTRWTSSTPGCWP